MDGDDFDGGHDHGGDADSHHDHTDLPGHHHSLEKDWEVEEDEEFESDFALKRGWGRFRRMAGWKKKVLVVVPSLMVLHFGYGLWQAGRSVAAGIPAGVLTWLLNFVGVLEFAFFALFFFKLTAAISDEGLRWQRHFSRRQPRPGVSGGGWPGWVPFPWKTRLTLALIQGVVLASAAGILAAILNLGTTYHPQLSWAVVASAASWGFSCGAGWRLLTEIAPKIKSVRWCNISLVSIVMSALAWSCFFGVILFFFAVTHFVPQGNISLANAVKSLPMMMTIGCLLGGVMALTRRIFPDNRNAHGHYQSPLAYRRDAHGNPDLSLGWLNRLPGWALKTLFFLLGLGLLFVIYEMWHER